MKKIDDRKNTSFVRPLLLITGSLIALFIILMMGGCDENEKLSPGDGATILFHDLKHYDSISMYHKI